jgi:putative ABC transport system permease protein
VREALRGRLPPAPAAIISTRDEYLAEMHDALGALSVLLRAVVAVALVVALMAVSTSLVLSVAERTREIGVLKALGVSPAQIGGSVVLHAITIAVVSLAIALPLGDLLARLLRERVSMNVAGFRFPRAFPGGTVAVVAAVLPFVAAAAAWVPARLAARLHPAQAIAHEP